MHIAQDYVRRRAVGAVVSVACPDSALSTDAETIEFAKFRQSIETPIRSFLDKHRDIDFIVLTKGIPIRIAGKGSSAEVNRYSLDGYLAAIGYDSDPEVSPVDIRVPSYDEATGPRQKVFHARAWANRYWNSQERFSHAKFGGYLVTRLDGYTEADAKSLVTRSLLAERSLRTGKSPTGEILLNASSWIGFTSTAVQPYSIRQPSQRAGEVINITNEVAHLGDLNSDMQLAAELLRERNIPVELEIKEHFVGDRMGLIGYLSWASNDRTFTPEAYHSLTFAPGAIGDTGVSGSGRTMLPTVGGQSLSADLVAQGISGIKAYTDEPLVQAMAFPSILFDRYTRGWTLAESFYAASALVGWEDLVIGDPLTRAYPCMQSHPHC